MVFPVYVSIVTFTFYRFSWKNSCNWLHAISSSLPSTDTVITSECLIPKLINFINCVAFGKTGEFIEKYTHQGTKLIAEGRIQTGSYTNKDGNKVYTTDVVVENAEFAESKSSQNNNQASRPEPVGTAGDGFMNIPDGVEDSGLPFN